MGEAQLQSPANSLTFPDGKSTTRRRSSSSGSNSFEFCVLRKANLLSADELFSDGVLLPLYCPASPDLIALGAEQQQSVSEPDHPHLSGAEQPALGPDHSVSSAAKQQPGLEFESAAVVGSSSTASKRWRNIFKRVGNGGENTTDKKGGFFGAHASERVLNINIWPFRRSNSAGNGGCAPAPGTASPKVSSAPCSPTDFHLKKSPVPRKARSNLAWPPRRSTDCRTKSGAGCKGWGKVSPAAGDGCGGDWYNKARVLTMKASDSPASGSGVSGEGRRSNLGTLFSTKLYED
ncbi:unnamed protein product [Cuscuta epithymum]|uniref:Uncharacterized protein n=1 Tax=Cuscuta epithymum TaxID=186058 RepID=A0AAV0EH97_9ASTE|nr:unnamed protein product [Cuscuta epithymum]CAH9121907.1 unnamed protein product [Cuscuta epithymum]